MRISYLHLLVSIIVAISNTANKGYPTKNTPQFSTSIKDPELKVITDEYFRLSARYNIKFKSKVSMGFSKISKESVIGVCSYRPSFREIDLDSEYWKKANWNTKLALTFHELTHCYCGRDHDFGNGTMYPDGSIKWVIQKLFLAQPLTPLKPPGFFEDKCPTSIMYPVVLDNQCFLKHYSYYVQEMFSRCQPYEGAK